VLLFLLWDKVSAFDECQKFVPYVKRAHEFYFGIDYPYWFSVGQLRTESNCIWTISRDGWGSFGPAQITPRFWDEELAKVHRAWKESLGDYFMAQVYILKRMQEQNKCGKLYVMYQCYNRSCKKVIKENFPECRWEVGLSRCSGRDVCVWRRGDRCLQWRNECEINYEYGVKVWRNGLRYKEWETSRWQYW